MNPGSKIMRIFKKPNSKEIVPKEQKRKRKISRWFTAKECYEDRELEEMLRRDVDVKLFYKSKGISFK